MGGVLHDGLLYDHNYMMVSSIILRHHYNAHDGLRGRPDGDRLVEVSRARLGHPRHLRRKVFDVVSLRLSRCEGVGVNGECD